MKAGWEVRTLNEVCSFENGDRGENYPSKSVQTTSGVPFINAGHLTETGLNFRAMNYIPRDRFELLGNGKIRKHDILFCLRGSLGKCASVGELDEGAIASSLVIVRPKWPVTPRFLSAYFQSDLCASMIDKYKNGAAQPNLSAGSLRQFKVPVPPLLEQERIVAILDDAFEGISTAKANTEKNLQNAADLLNAGFTMFASKEEQSTWQKKTVAEVAAPHKGSIRTGPFGSQLLHGEFVDEGIAVLGIDNAVANEFRWGKTRFITQKKYEQLRRYTVFPGDVLITIMGTCGRCAVVPEDIPTAINTKHLCCITVNLEKCIPEYLHAYFLYHPKARDFLEIRAKGSIMDGLNMAIIQELPLLLPSIDRQKEIVGLLTSLRTAILRLQSIYKQKLTTLDVLKKSLLQEAFTGQL